MRRTKLLLFALLLVLLVIGWSVVAHAQVFRSGSNVSLPAGKVINNSVFAAGRTVNIAGVVNGDVFCAGQDVTVSAQVRGDVVCTGQNVTITGSVTGDIRLMGQDVKLGAGVTGNATIGAQTFVEQPEANIHGDLTLGGQDATLQGTIGRDVSAAVNTLTITGMVNRNVETTVHQLHLDNKAKVAGNVSYTSSSVLQRSKSAQVGGKVTKHSPTNQAHGGSKKTVWLFGLYLACLIGALVLVLLLPRVFEHAARIARRNWGKTFLIGLVASIVGPVLLVAALVSLIGIPLGIVFGLVWLLAVLLAAPFAAYLFARSLVRGEANAILVMLVGAAILFFAFLLPYVGWILWLISMWFGLGAIVRAIASIGRPRYNTRSLSTPTPITPEPAAP